MFEAVRDENDYVGEDLLEELSWWRWSEMVEDMQDEIEYCEKYKYK